MSEGHLRQMELYRQSPDKFMNQFSKMFEKGFMDIFKVRYVALLYDRVLLTLDLNCDYEVEVDLGF